MTWITVENPLFAGPNDEFAKYHWHYTQSSPPKELFHYASEEGLMNMIRSKCIWATESSFLNDRSELHAGIQIFRDALSNFSNSDFVSTVQQVLTDWQNHFSMLFVVSLSEHGDLLSQWRAYANDGAGYSIGFSTETIKKRAGFGEFVGLDPDKLSKTTANFFQLMKVVYQTDEQRQIAEEFLRLAKMQFDALRGNAGDEDPSASFKVICGIRLQEFLISFKSAEYEEEREWRIVAPLRRTHAAIDFRITKYGMAPFVRVNIASREELDAPRLPITTIMIGPRNPSKSNRQGLHLFLSREKCEAQVRESGSTYR